MTERLLRCGVLLLAIGAGGACEGDDEGAYACGPPADRCLTRLCITEIDGFSFEDCCDSEVCNCTPGRSSGRPSSAIHRST